VIGGIGPRSLATASRPARGRPHGPTGPTGADRSCVWTPATTKESKS
jgi:hypothetical protein